MPTSDASSRPRAVPAVPSEVDAALLADIRRLRSFTHECDLDALAVACGSPLALLERLVAERLVHKDEAGQLWSRRIGFAYVNPEMVVITEAAVQLLPAAVATKVGALPLYAMGDTLTLALAHPEDAALVRRLGHICQHKISPLFAWPSDVADHLRLHYASEASLDAALNAAAELEQFTAGVDLAAGGREIARFAESKQVVQFLDAVVYFAMRRDASDIHIEPLEEESRVRYRIDGNLRDVLGFPRKLHGSIVARLKFLSGCDITEARLPADGRFSLPFGTGKVDFRFSSIPTQYGEKAVVRILGSTSRKSLLTLDKMMISQSVIAPLRRVLHSPNGIIFVTGPTGSGKTTTLYAALAELNQPDVNISTVEDPIELRLAGVNQTQINPQIDMTFGRMLRALLRQDPDILLVGEIRDLETAKIATEAALTGHLVLATLHTNSAPEAIIRLQEMGVDPYLVAPSVVAVLAQRLAARICENCKESYRPSEEVLRRCFHDEKLPEVSFYRGRGCHVCGHTGFKGRVAFHELLLVDQAMRESIATGRAGPDLARLGERVGYRPLRYDGLKKVLLGLTTIEEITAQTPAAFEG